MMWLLDYIQEKLHSVTRYEMQAYLNHILQALDPEFPEIAQEECAKTQRFIDDLESRNPNNSLKRTLALGYFDLGISLRDLRQFEHSESSFRKALKHLEALTQSKFHHNFAESQIGANYNHLGLTFHEEEKYTEAIEWYDRAIQHRRKGRNFSNAENQVYLGGALCNRGHVAAELDQIEEARDFYNEAISIIQKALPKCECGLQLEIAKYNSCAQGNSNWIVLAHQFKANAEAGLQSLAPTVPKT